MKILLLLLSTVIVLPFGNSLTRTEETPLTTVCLTNEEIELYDLISRYRKSKKLPVIPISASLTTVAQLHSKDLYENKPHKDPCNPHSWSNRGTWKACCYYSDHRNTKCMWDKPKELTNYKGAGYEIAYFHSARVLPTEALDAWKKSKGHNPVIINSGIWKGQTWNAIGIGIYKNYATVWFGMEPDPANKPVQCDSIE